MEPKQLAFEVLKDLGGVKYLYQSQIKDAVAYTAYRLGLKEIPAGTEKEVTDALNKLMVEGLATAR